MCNPPWRQIATRTACVLANNYRGWWLCDRDDILSLCLTQAWLHRDEPESHQLLEMRESVSKEVRKLYHLQSKDRWSAKFIFWSDDQIRDRVCDLPADFRDPWVKEAPDIEDEQTEKSRRNSARRKQLHAEGKCRCGRSQDVMNRKMCRVCLDAAKEAKAKSKRKEKQHG